MQYADFTIRIMGESGRYNVAALGPHEISVPPVIMMLNLTEELSAEVESIAQGFAPTRDRMQAVGTVLYDAIFPRRIAKAFSRAYDDLPAGSQIRLRLAIQPPELNRLPWEMLFDPDEEIFLGARLRYPLVRYVESGTPVASLAVGDRLRVLYIQAQPQGMAALNLEASEQALRAGLGDRAEITVVRDCTAEQLREHLREPYHVLHYDGHAYFDEERQMGMLCLEDAAGETYHLSGEMLATYLDGTSVRLVVLAACESGKDSPTKRFSGIAHQIMKSSDLPAVVAMQFAVVDASAIAFNKGFYSGLAAYMPVEAALVEGRKGILETIGGDPFGAPDWATPVLFMRTKDGNLISDPESRNGMTGNSEKDDKLNVSFGDGTKIDGDLKIGNKSSISTGNINATGGGMVNIAGGDISQTITQSSSSPKQATLEDLTLMLDELTHLIGRAGLDNDIQVEAKDMVKKALDQLVAENPRKALVELRLKNMLDLVTAVGGADSAIAKIQDLVHRSVKIAGELFD